MTTRAVNNSVAANRAWFDFTTASDIRFATRVTLAGIAALFVAMWLQLDVPRWALWTVFIVSPPVRGNALRKTGARLLGTLVGCVAALAMVGLFPQDRIGFYLVFSGWLGGCAYFATLRRGYVSYAIVLAAFTSAIIAGDVDSAPLGVWEAAVSRGSATLLGVIFAYFASDVSARSDDVPLDLADRIRMLGADLLDWAAGQLGASKSREPRDAPLTGKILGLDETIANAIAERPALGWVKPWIVGLPTALLSLQTAALRLRDSCGSAATSKMADRLAHFADVLRSNASLPLQSLRRESRSWATAAADGARNGDMPEIAAAISYLGTSLEAIFGLRPPAEDRPLYPRPRFAAHPNYAAANLIRCVVGIWVGFAIWEATAWSVGDLFMVYLAVALVLFVASDDPVAGNWPNLIGNLVGGLVALAAKYLVLVHTSDTLTLTIILLPTLFVGAWLQTKPALASFGLFYLNGLLIVLSPSNPQQYDFAGDLNGLIAVIVAYAFVPIVFLAIGTPRHGAEREAQLLSIMRRQRLKVASASRRQGRLLGETQMYDELHGCRR